MKHSTTIIFGKEQVDKYLNGAKFTVEEKELYLKKYSFDSEIELVAFLKGINEVVGWSEVYQIEADLIN